VSVPFTVSSTEDAISLAERTLGNDRLAALVTGSRLAIPISGDPPADAVLRWDELLLDAIGDQHDHLLLATRRHTGPAFILEDELQMWRRLRMQHTGHNLVLSDWLVFVRDEVVLSLAELAGPPAAWE
jgi:hypothetical protein